MGGDCGFRRTGFLQLVDRVDHPTLRDNLRRLRGIGLDTRLVDATEIAELQPGLRLTGDELAGYEPRSGHADPLATTRSLADAARRGGARVLAGSRSPRCAPRAAGCAACGPPRARSPRRPLCWPTAPGPARYWRRWASS